jgi:hypothetical protein
MQRREAIQAMLVAPTLGVLPAQELPLPALAVDPDEAEVRYPTIMGLVGGGFLMAWCDGQDWVVSHFGDDWQHKKLFRVPMGSSDATS